MVLRTVSVKTGDGLPIEGLEADDFIVMEDGRHQAISFFEFHKIDETSPREYQSSLPPSFENKPERKPDLEIPVSNSSARTRYKNRRLLAFYFDLEGVSESGRVRSFEAVKKFIETKMAAADRAAILTYSDGTVRLVSDFTDNRRHLLESIRTLQLRDIYDTNTEVGWNEGEFDIFQADRRLIALHGAFTMLERLSEAKSLLYFSGGVVLNVNNLAQLQATLNAAVRANVSIYPIDSRSLSAFAPMGDASRPSPGGIAMYSGVAGLEEIANHHRAQDGLHALAEGTGGRVYLDSNDLIRGIIDARHAMSSYYTLGYYPAETRVDGSLHHIEIKLKNRAERLTYRNTYYSARSYNNYTETDRERQLLKAFLQEDPITEIPIALELNHFWLKPNECSVPVAVQIPGSELLHNRAEDADRIYVDIMGEARNDFGAVVSKMRDMVEISLKDRSAQKLSSGSIQYDTVFRLPPGGYSIKFLVRELGTGRIGTYIGSYVIPELNSNALPLPISSVVLSNRLVATQDALFVADKGNHAGSQFINPMIRNGWKLTPNISRVFDRSSPLYIYLQAYGSDTPLTAYVSVYRKYEKVLETQPLLVEVLPKGTLPVFDLDFAVSLEGLQNGEHTCQVTVLDAGHQRVAFWRVPISITSRSDLQTQ